MTSQFHQVATSPFVYIKRLLQLVICRFIYNLLKQLAASLLKTGLDNQLATSLLTTCNELVVKKLSQANEAMQTHPDIGLL